MKRKHRHELKQNEFLLWLEQAALWYSQNKKSLLNAVIVVAAATAIVSGIYLYRESRDSAADTAFKEALNLFHGHIQEESSVVQVAEGPVFKSAEERYRQALAAFENIANTYPNRPQGRRARYYAAVCQAGLGDYEAAETLLEEVTARREDLAYYLASQALAVARSEQGKHEEAIEVYRLLIEDPETPLPKDQLLSAMAGEYERAGDLEEARRNYQRVLEEFPNSRLRVDVLRKSELITYKLEG